MGYSVMHRQCLSSPLVMTTGWSRVPFRYDCFRNNGNKEIYFLYSSLEYNLKYDEIFHESYGLPEELTQEEKHASLIV